MTTDELTAARSLPEEQLDPAGAPASGPHTEMRTVTSTPSPAPLELEVPAAAQNVIVRAREDLAHKLDLAADAIQLVSVESVEWPDLSLGCPQPEMQYAQMVTPGFSVVLEARGERHAYHTDREHRVRFREEEHSGRAPGRGADVPVQDGWPSHSIQSRPF